jgi:mRNA-degrading endonuclease RelE of RelBE toxin-antitoxin system
MASEDWTWKFTPRAADQFDTLDPHIQDRIVSKLDEVVASEWRDPGEFLDPSLVVLFRNSVSDSTDSPVRSTGAGRY